ncbi:SCO family protein [Piscinibacter defluvii]|uniref:SCO family protein n=1 Tax=Piscinibacter defluvii TaxID=1796922 RepID=UPI000FDF3633|nr:hypothetical protein [Piscinibacter defluvii]
MSGSNSSDRGSGAELEAPSPLALTVHSLPAPTLDDAARRTALGRLKMFLILVVCAAPVIASYLAYYVVRPEGRTNYGSLIEPARAMPAALPLADLDGRPVAPASLQGQWLFVVVGGGACDAGCEQRLWLQRQVREALGREKGRIDKLWLVDDAAMPRAETLAALQRGDAVTVLRTERAALAAWLAPEPGHRLEEHFYLVDPQGLWMMRMPAQPDPSRLKRDLERLLRASAGWDRPGRP